MQVTVIKVHSSGLTVRLPDGQDGFIPRKELSWSHANSRPHAQFQEGQQITVVPLPQSGTANRPVLSVKQTIPDPWERAKHSYSVGQDVLGVVTAVFEDAAFVEFEEGVTGRIPRAEIGPSAAKCGPDVLSLGDVIRSRITGVLDSKRHFQCSNTQAVDAAHRRRDPSFLPTRDPVPLTRAKLGDPNLFHTGPISVLLIDDDESFCVATQRAFELGGHSLEFTTNPVIGIQQATKKAYDIVVVDLIMPNMRGDEVCRTIRGIDDTILLAIFTGEVAITSEELADLSPPPLVLHKPFDIADVEAACFDEIRSQMQLVPKLVKEAHEFLEKESVEVGLDADRYVIEQIQRLAKTVPCTILGVFKWTEDEQRLKYLHGTGFRYVNGKNQMERQIFYSPLRNIAEDHELVTTNSVSTSTLAFRRWMKNLYPYTEFFESFCGAPVVVRDRTKYIVLFAHILPNMYPESVQDHIWNQLVVISAELKVQEAYQQIESLQRLALRGELTASLTHEIRNRLHIISMNLKAMKNLGPKAAHKLRQRSVFVPEELDKLNEILNETQGAVNQINNVVTAFSEDIAQHSHSEFDLCDLVQAVVARLGPIAKSTRVIVYLDLPAKCPASGPHARLGQVFENLILNAIQHTAAFRRTGAEVVVRCGKTEGPSSYFVEVQDNGPGVHAKDRERIFAMGFTTKHKGSGVGLALCAAAMKAADGRVYVKESVIFEGVTIRAEWSVGSSRDE